MSLSLKKQYKIISVTFLIVFILSGCSKRGSEDITKNTSEIPTVNMSASYLIDINNPRELIGDADRAFVGYVEEQIGNEYLFPDTVPSETGDRKISCPFTTYNITVLENIKGDLPVNVPILMYKDGGLVEDQSCYELYKDDTLPEVGSTYLFTMYIQPDGTYIISGANSNIKMDLDMSNKTRSMDSIKNSEIYQTYLDAYQNEIVREGKIVKD